MTQSLHDKLLGFVARTQSGGDARLANEAIAELTRLTAIVDKLERENANLRSQLVATLAGTFNVAPKATTTMCGRLDESGELLASVKQMAASLHSIKPDEALATLRTSKDAVK